MLQSCFQQSHSGRKAKARLRLDITVPDRVCLSPQFAEINRRQVSCRTVSVLPHKLCPSAKTEGTVRTLACASCFLRSSRHRCPVNVTFEAISRSLFVDSSLLRNSPSPTRINFASEIRLRTAWKDRNSSDGYNGN